MGEAQNPLFNPQIPSFFRYYLLILAPCSLTNAVLFMNIKPTVLELLQKPLWQLTGEEYVSLHAYAVKMAGSNGDHAAPPARITGVRSLAEYLDCCESTIYMLIRNGAIDDAIVSRIGKKIVFDGEIARRCANDYQEQQRAQRSAGNTE